MSDSINIGNKTKLCPVCKAEGKTNKLRLYQINLTEAVLVCAGEKCTYPMGIEPSQNIIFLRDATSATFSKKKLQSSPWCSSTATGQATSYESQKSLGNQSYPTAPNKSCSTSTGAVLAGLTTFRTAQSVSRSNGFSSYMAEVGSSRQYSESCAQNKADRFSTLKCCVDQSSQVGSTGSQQHEWHWLTAVFGLLIHSNQLQRKAELNCTKSNLLMLLKKCIPAQFMSRLNGDRRPVLKKVLHNLQDVMSSVIKNMADQRSRKKGDVVNGLEFLLRRETSLMQTCWIKATKSTVCDTCNRQKKKSLETPILTLSRPQNDFKMSDIEETQQTCENCLSSTARVRTTITHYPSVIFAHFTHGLHTSSPVDCDFHSPDGSSYRVKGIIQHQKEVDHYTTWIRDVTNGTWMEYDDQNGVPSSVSALCVTFPPSEVVLVMWESDQVSSSSAAKCVSGSVEAEQAIAGKLYSKLSQKSNVLSKRTEVCSSSEEGQDFDLSCGIRNCVGAAAHVNVEDNSHGASTVTERRSPQVVESFVPENTSIPDNIPYTADKLKSMESMMNEKSNPVNWLKSNPVNAKNVSVSSAKNSASAEMTRVQRLRERFLKDKQKLQDRRLITDAPERVHLISHHNATASQANFTPSNLQKHSMTDPGAKPVRQSGSEKTIDNGGFGQKIESESAKLQNSVLDRVLKYLPKGTVPKLPFINIEKPNAIQKSKSKNRVSFQGYVPKSIVTYDNQNGEEESTAPQKDVSNSKASNTTEKQVHISVSLGEASNKLHLSVSQCRRNNKDKVDIGVLKKRLKRSAEELACNEINTNHGVSTLNKRSVASSSLSPAKKHRMSAPGINPAAFSQEEIDQSQDYQYADLANTEYEPNHQEKVQTSPDKVESVKTCQNSSFHSTPTITLYGQYGFNEVSPFSQSVIWDDDRNTDNMDFGESGQSTDYQLLDTFSASPLKSSQHHGNLFMASDFQPTFSSPSSVSGCSGLNSTFTYCNGTTTTYPTCHMPSSHSLNTSMPVFQHPLKERDHSSSDFTFSPLLLHSPERTGMSLLTDGRAKVQWS